MHNDVVILVAENDEGHAGSEVLRISRRVKKDGAKTPRSWNGRGVNSESRLKFALDSMIPTVCGVFASY
jgi:hypothetical protein